MSFSTNLIGCLLAMCTDILFWILIPIPITTFLTRPAGFLEKTITTLVNLTPGLTSAVQVQTIPALTAFYVFFTFAFANSFSRPSLPTSSPGGLAGGKNPRDRHSQLDDLLLRLNSAYSHLMEKFAGFAVAAALAQLMAPDDAQIVNLWVYMFCWRLEWVIRLTC